MGAPSLEVLKARLGGAVGSLSRWGATSLQQGVGLGGLQGPFQPQPFCDSVSCSATTVKLEREVIPFLLFVITCDRINLLC